MNNCLKLFWNSTVTLSRMPEIKLTYFNIEGKAELIRILLHAGNFDFEVSQVSHLIRLESVTSIYFFILSKITKSGHCIIPVTLTLRIFGWGVRGFRFPRLFLIMFLFGRGIWRLPLLLVRFEHHSYNLVLSHFYHLSSTGCQVPTLVWDGVELAQSTAIARFFLSYIHWTLVNPTEVTTTSKIFQLLFPGLLPGELAWRATMTLNWQELTWWSLKLHIHFIVKSIALN